MSIEERTDTQRLDELEQLAREGDCPGIIHDDNGHWAVTGDGVQDVARGNDPESLNTSFYVTASQWRTSLRAAIDSYLDRDTEGNKR